MHGSYYEEVVEFSDGTVRSATRAIVNRKVRAADSISPYTVTATDALCTGPTGHNREVIRRLMTQGYDVEWLHHQGRHTKQPKTVYEGVAFLRALVTKSVGRSAHQQHAYLDDIASQSENQLRTVFAIGESRGGMTGEAVIALARQYGRTVAYSDFLAQCYEHRPTRHELLESRTIPIDLLRALGRIGYQIIHADARNGNFRRTGEHLGTLDLHPYNLLNETAWVLPLMSGEAGAYADRIPNDSQGTRTLLDQDKMSQVSSWQERHAGRQGIRFIIERGTHLDLADKHIQERQRKRFERLMQQMQHNGFSLTGVNFDYVTHGRQPVVDVA